MGKETANANRDPCHKHGVRVFQFRLTDTPSTGNCNLSLDHTQYAPHVVRSGRRFVCYFSTSTARSTRDIAPRLNRRRATQSDMPLIPLHSHHLQHNAAHFTRSPDCRDDESACRGPVLNSLDTPSLQPSTAPRGTPCAPPFPQKQRLKFPASRGVAGTFVWARNTVVARFEALRDLRLASYLHSGLCLSSCSVSYSLTAFSWLHSCRLTYVSTRHLSPSAFVSSKTGASS